MARILVTPEDVRAAASQFKQSSEQSNQMVQKLQSTINNLDQQWDGMSSQKFMTDFGRWAQMMGQFVGLLDDINKQLIAVADRFEQADKA